MKVVGIDGCIFGWIAVSLNTFESWYVQAFQSID